MEYKIALIPGDGIGPEIVAEAKKVLDRVCEKYSHKFSYTEVLLGGASIDAHGLGLGLVYEVTKEPIARTEEQAKKEAWQTVFSDVSLEDFKAVDVDKKAADKTAADLGIKATVDEVCEAADEGYVVTVTGL